MTDFYAKYQEILTTNQPLIDRLDAMAREVFPTGRVLDYFKPVKYDFSSSFQVIPKDAIVCLLDPRQNVTLPLHAKEYMCLCKQSGDAYLARHAMSTEHLKELVEDKTKFTVQIGAVYQELLNSLMHRIENTSGYDICMFLTGRTVDSMFLIDPNDEAKLEVRLWALLK
jgi:hypothetical protein